MTRKQVYHTPKRKCSRCLYERRDTEKASERLWPPSGGYLCPECLVPAAIEALKRSKEEEVTRQSGIPAPTDSVKELTPESAKPQQLNGRERKELRKKGKFQFSITCPECHEKSYDKFDIAQGFCKICSWWTSDPVMSKVAKEDREVT